MIFTRCKNEKHKELYCGLYISLKRGKSWEEPKLIPFCNDISTFKTPALSADEQVLIFSSDRPGGYGGNDLWMSLYDKKTKTWTEPANLGPEINTSGYEGFPFLHDDGTLYFSSKIGRA